MRQVSFLFVLFLLAACEEIFDVKGIEGPCTIQMVDGSTITVEKSIEIIQSTGTITYKDEDGKLWSITADEYLTYSCGN
ncbi:DUF903 domain-containing protein [Algoriphagus sp. A40]|uniref:DUF903 domain-containing protein n=1 Tax=Algoriphagus sp. A40 TaxID=1945863 RepID=UPI0009871BCC|nr:DUF903 domain-containing protein [Algoriphagus sp. A40]OOG75295.1 hypothetical protein B0E43_09940 [Algoriphagus sp. A40]